MLSIRVRCTENEQKRKVKTTETVFMQTGARKILPGAIKTQMELFASVATINTFGLKDQVQKNLKKLLQSIVNLKSKI